MRMNQPWALLMGLVLLLGCLGATEAHRFELAAIGHSETAIAQRRRSPVKSKPTAPQPPRPTAQPQPPAASKPNSPTQSSVSQPPAQTSNATAPSVRPTQPTYQLGVSDGGPGQWVQSPKRSGGVEHQKKVTGAPEGVEYAVPADTKSGKILFDGYKDGKLIDAKDWKKWPPEDKAFWRKNVLEEARDQVKAAKGTPIEWHFSTREKADYVRGFLRENGVQGLSVKGPQ